MSTTWGDGTWGSSTWSGSGVPAIAGVAATGSVSLSGWGVDAWGSDNWGETQGTTLTSSITKELTGVAATGARGSVTPSVLMGIGGSNWGAGTWGADTWGGVLAATTGAVGTFVYSPTVTGVAATGSVSFSGWGANAWGYDNWGETQGTTLTTSITKELTGVAATGARGSVSYGLTFALLSGWGASAWGASAWGAGNGIFGAAGTSVYTPELAGVAATCAVGTLTPTVLVALTGFQAEANTGAVTAVASRTLALTGVYADVSVGVIERVRWPVIDNDQTPNWGTGNTAQTPNWAPVNAAQNSAWTSVNSAQTGG